MRRLKIIYRSISESREPARFAAFLFLEKKMDLEDWRTEIDGIDLEIVRLLNRRARVVRKIGRLKARAGLPALDSSREERVLHNICRAEFGGLGDSAMRRIFIEILRESRRIQESQRELINAGRVEA